MPETDDAAPAKLPSAALTLTELVRAELQGKIKALAAYDDILWKVRSGYVIVLYSIIGLLIGKESKLPALLERTPLLVTLFAISVGISACAFLIDVAFTLGKLRVVVARNRLGDLAIVMAEGALSDLQKAELVQLLHLSGEATTLPPLRLLLLGSWSLPLLYLFSPLALYLLTR